MDLGYPTTTVIDAFLGALGVEQPAEYTQDWYDELKRAWWSVCQLTAWGSGLRVYAASDTTINVTAGTYLFRGQVKTFSPGSAIDPTDNDTTYVWLTAANAIDSGIDGDGWPATEHIRLAEVTVDSDGNITNITDLRGRSFYSYAGSHVYGDGASAEVMGVEWESASAADSDAMTIGLYARNDAATPERIEYGRITITLDDVSDGSEAASISFSVMVGGAMTGQGEFVGTLSANATGESAAVQANATGGLPVIFRATLTAGSTVQVHNSDAPYAYRVLDAWSVATSADGGTWKLTDGSNDITDAVAVTATDKTIDRAGTIDDDYHAIAASGSLSVVGDGANADVEVYILAVRV